MANIKVSVLEIDGEELAFPTERLLSSSDCFFSDPLLPEFDNSSDAIVGVAKKLKESHSYYQIEEDIKIPEYRLLLTTRLEIGQGNLEVEGALEII